jgi:hypothetical protein
MKWLQLLSFDGVVEMNNSRKRKAGRDRERFPDVSRRPRLRNHAVLQRCAWHKRENVVRYLRKRSVIPVS